MIGDGAGWRFDTWGAFQQFLRDHYTICSQFKASTSATLCGVGNTLWRRKLPFFSSVSRCSTYEWMPIAMRVSHLLARALQQVYTHCHCLHSMQSSPLQIRFQRHWKINERCSDKKKKQYTDQWLETEIGSNLDTHKDINKTKYPLNTDLENKIKIQNPSGFKALRWGQGHLFYVRVYNEPETGSML